MDRRRKGGSPAARILSLALGASMALGLMPGEGLAWARAQAMGQADDAAEVMELGGDELDDGEGLAEGRDAQGLVTEDQDAQDQGLVTEDQDGAEELADGLISEDLVAEGDAVEEDRDEAVEGATVEEPVEPEGAEQSVEPAEAEEAVVARKDDVPEWAVDDGADALTLTTQAALPSRYDLRDDGFVTPVKAQTPWNSCWAFAGIAAAESSILSSAGTTYAEGQLDLSERHLAWYALHPVTELDNPAQAGEGLRPVSDALDACYDIGGRAIYITTLFSQGVGPLPEVLFPYRGVGTDGMSHLAGDFGITLAEFEKDPEQGVLTVLAKEINDTKDKARQTLEQMAERESKTYEVKLAELEATIRRDLLQTSFYAKNDDWTIPATDPNGHSNRTDTAFEVL